MLWNLLVGVAIAYAAIVALVFVFQAGLVFFPESARELRLGGLVFGHKGEGSILA